jgi:hypothetical protein
LPLGVDHFGDAGRSGGSGRLAVTQGYDAVKLDLSYNSSYMNLFNRSKVKIQKTFDISTFNS